MTPQTEQNEQSYAKAVAPLPLSQPSPSPGPASSPAPLTLGQFLRQIWVEADRDDVLGHAAQLAFYFMFALFPMLLFLAALLGFLPIPNLFNRMLDYVGRVVPPMAMSLVSHTLAEVVRRPRKGLLSFGLLATIWAASSGVHALISSINVAYGVRQARGWWRDRVRAIQLTLGFVVLIVAALILIFFGGHISAQVASVYGFGLVFKTTWNILQWPIVVGFVLLACEMIYHYAPNIDRPRRWVTPGGLFAVTAWLLLSYGFRFYVSRFANYTLTYGSIGSVMVLMLWLYLTGIAVLVGGEINAILLERKTSRLKPSPLI